MTVLSAAYRRRKKHRVRACSGAPGVPENPKQALWRKSLFRTSLHAAMTGLFAPCGISTTAGIAAFFSLQDVKIPANPAQREILNRL